MKLLKTLLIIIVILVVLIGILTMVAPTKMSVTRSVMIDAPPSLVYGNISSQHNMHKWYPWDRRDPHIQISYEGSDATVGEKSSWKGNDQVGQGEITTTSLDPGKSVGTQIHFIKPFNSVATATFLLADTAGGTRVSWTFDSNMPRPFNIMGLFMDMNSAIGKDFDEGLGYLKELSEKDEAESTVMDDETSDAFDEALNAIDSIMGQ